MKRLMKILLFLLFCLTIISRPNVSEAQTPTLLPGDANSDGRVDGLDYVIWLNNYGLTDATGVSQGDFNNDRRVDGLDYVVWLNNYGRIAPTPTLTQALANTATPTINITATPTPTLPAGTISVNFSINDGPVTYRATGLIGASISDTQPPSSVMLPLKPQTLSWVMHFRGITRATQNNIRYQLKLWNMSLIPSSADGDWSGWERHVRDYAQRAKDNNYHTIEFDIWNEPEYSQYWTPPIDERYFQMWNRAYREIKRVDPNFIVVGPSTTSMSWLRNTFLPRVRSDNSLPDVLSWHMLYNGEGAYQSIQNTRTWLQNNSYNISKISINEYIDSSNSRRPGVLVRFMSEFERARVDSAAKACWQEGGNWNCEIHMNNLLTYPDQQPRSAWWTYRQYAEMTGNLVTFTGSSTFVGLASADSSTRKGYVLLGNVNSASAVTVNLTNLNSAPFYVAGRPLNILVQKIPNTEANPLTSPITVSQTTINPSSSYTSHAVSITGVGLYDAYFITLSTQ